MIRFATDKGISYRLNEDEVAATGIVRIDQTTITERIPTRTATDTGEIKVDGSLLYDVRGFAQVVKATPDELCELLYQHDLVTPAADLAEAQCELHHDALHRKSSSRVVSAERGVDPTKMPSKLLKAGE